jgi:hypothetical protein
MIVCKVSQPREITECAQQDHHRQGGQIDANYFRGEEEDDQRQNRHNDGHLSCEGDGFQTAPCPNHIRQFAYIDPKRITLQPACVFLYRIQTSHKELRTSK